MGVYLAVLSLHRHQRRFVMARTPANDPPLVPFNSWYPFQGKMTVADMKRCADVAAELGAEGFVLDAGWWDFMFRVPMNGQFGISSRVFEWNNELKQPAKQAIADYKRLRRVRAGADVYHLTPPPPRDQPGVWAGPQYVSPDRQRSVLMAYRLRQSTREHVFCLRGLAPQTTFAIKIDGQFQREATGQPLRDTGLWVLAEDEGRARIVERDAVKAPERSQAPADGHSSAAFPVISPQ